MDEYAEVVKFTSGNSALNDQQLTQLRDQVWNTYVNNKLIEHEAEELGLTVTDAEIQSIISEGNSPILMQTPFRNEQTGRFDANVLKKFLTDYEGMKTKSEQMPAEYMDYYNSLYKFWMFIEKDTPSGKSCAKISSTAEQSDVRQQNHRQGRIRGTYQ